MKKQLVGLTLILLSAPWAWAQPYRLAEATQRVNNQKYAGVTSWVEGPYSQVEEDWLDYLRQHGKIRRKRNYYQISDLQYNGLPDTLVYVTRVSNKDSLGLIWIAPLTRNLPAGERQKLMNTLKKLLKEGTRHYYLAQAQAKIDESEAAALVMSKKHQRLLYEKEKLAEDLRAAQELKAELEARLEETNLKIKSLNQQILDTDSAAVQAYRDLEEIKQVIEHHKEELKKIK